MKKNILMIFPGPKDNVRETFQDRLENLSDSYGGYVLTTSYADCEEDICGFRVIAHGEVNFRSLGTYWRLLKKSLAIGEAMKNEGRPLDLVVTYDPLTSGLIGMVVSRKFRAKFVTEVNGDYQSTFTYIDIKNPIKRQLVRARNIFVMSLVLRAAHGVKAQYGSQISFLPAWIVPKVFRSFANYTDLSNFHPLSASDSNQILFVGFPYKLKGVDLLIRSFKKISEEHPDWRLKVVGWYPNKEEIISEIDGHPAIELLDPVERSVIARYMSESSIFVLPSRSEAVARVLLEAGAIGLARIGSTAGGIPSTITNEVDGLLFESGNADELAKQLNRLMCDKDLRLRLGAAAKEASLSGKFNKKTYYSHAKALYRDALERG